MATERLIISCTVCQTRIAIRTLIGYLDRHPILLACPKCGIDISGELITDQETAKYSFKFMNATDVTAQDHENAEYYAEISGEFLTEKMTVLSDGKVPPFYSPLFKAIDDMGDDGYQTFRQRIIDFIQHKMKNWPELKKINELWANGQRDFCKAELRKLLPEDKYSLHNDLEILRAMKHLNVYFFHAILPEGFLDNDASMIADAFSRLTHTSTRQLVDLSRHFAAAHQFKRYRELFVSRVEHFIQTFPNLVPVFSAPFHPAGEDAVLRSKGLFTANVRTLGQFYVDTYENLIDMSSPIVALNNLIHRSDFMIMRNLRKDIKTLNDYDRLQKGDRLQFIQLDDEIFGNCLGNYINNKMRNSFGHGSTRFDPITQQLDFYSKGGQTTPAVTKYLAEFGNDCRMMLRGLFCLMEINSWIERIYLFGEGQMPDSIS